MILHFSLARIPQSLRHLELTPDGPIGAPSENFSVILIIPSYILFKDCIPVFPSPDFSKQVFALELIKLFMLFPPVWFPPELYPAEQNNCRVLRHGGGFYERSEKGHSQY
jgi:hypothetical protein